MNEAAREAIEALDPAFLAAYDRLEDAPKRTRALDEKTQALVRLAVDANATHLHVPSIRPDVAAALDAGASPAEIMGVLECCATLGIHAMNIGVPILVDVLEKAGMRGEAGPLTEYQERVKADFTRKRGYWNAFWDEILELAPEFFDAYTEFSAAPWMAGALSPKVMEFIYIAFDFSATHLYTLGGRAHIENAIRYGATAQELVEVLEIAVTLSMHAVTEAAPILVEESRKRGLL